MRQAMRRLQELGEWRLPGVTRRRRREPLPIDLHQRRVYIVPSGFGIGFTVLLMVMLLGALNYTNNAALLLTCLLGATGAISMLVTFRSLDGLRLAAISAGEAFAGAPLTLAFRFVSSRPRSAIRLDVDEHRLAFSVHVGDTVVELALATTRRGWQALPPVRVWSSWPLGLFRAWSWLHPEQHVLVWPKPEVGGPPPMLPAEASQRLRLQHGDDLAALREYRSGDPMRHIAWKASARHPGLLVKDFERPQSQLEWQLDWRQLEGLESEARIARLARWLGEAHASGRRHSLWLPGTRIETGSGAAHYARCMSALAVLP